MRLPLKKHKRATITLGTLVEVSLWLDDDHDPAPHFAAAYAALREVHACMSVHDDQSDLGRYRLAQTGEWLEISVHTATVLSFAEQLWETSHGLFDVCIGHILSHAGHLPAFGSATPSFRQRTRQLAMVKDAKGIRLMKQPDTVIDLGGIAKGYAIDHAIQVLQQRGVPAALVNAGGDMRIYGPVHAPVHLRTQADIKPLLTLHNQALASSGMQPNKEEMLNTLPIAHPHEQRCLPMSKTIYSIQAPSAMVADALTKLAWLGALSQEWFSRYDARLV